MGGAIALRLAGQGLDLIGWNRGRDKARLLAAQGLRVADSVEDALAVADICVLVLSDNQAIVDTLFNAETVEMLAGRIILQMGTIAPTESSLLAERVAAAGGAYLEAPVLGSLPEASEGRLIIMAGGEPDVFDRCQPILRLLGQNPRLIGPVGQGAALKLAMNQLIAGLTATFSLSLGLVRAEGINVEQFMDLLRTSALYAPTFDKKLPKYLSHEYGKANFPLKHLLKDVRLFRRVAEPYSMDAALIMTIEAACARAMGQGYGDQDYSSVYEAINPKR